MYIRNESGKKPMTLKQVKTAIKAEFTETELKKISEWELDAFSRDFYGLYTAMRKNWKIWAVCEKEPRGNLDTGNHYFSIHYLSLVKGNPEENRLWAYCDTIAKKFYFDINNRHKYIDKFIFASGAIGMSRRLDATDGLFVMMKKITGYYGQI